MDERREVVVTDINIPLSSIAIFMLRWVIASIPAFIVLAMLATAVTVAMAVILGIGSRLTPFAR